MHLYFYSLKKYAESFVADNQLFKIQNLTFKVLLLNILTVNQFRGDV